MVYKNYSAFYFLLLCLTIVSSALPAKAQLIVDTTTFTPQQLVQNVLLGNGVTVTNIACNCTGNAIGYFDGTNSNIGLSGGIVMTSGDAVNAVGPNIDVDKSTDNYILYADPQLTSIEPTADNDPCILEFDFIPDSNHVEFRYVFGSEEYHEFVFQGFNDAFGFFLTGPGIFNPNNNIALIPNSSTPISIDNVNNGYSFNCQSTGPCMNCQYFVDNCNGASVQYDGFTTTLLAQASVTPSLSYHIKLAIADATDGVYDSGVFIECGSFSSSGGRKQSQCSGLVHVVDYSNPAGAVIFPNPATDLLKVSTSENITGYKITNLFGQTLEEKNNIGNTSFSINIHDLAAGTYILNIYSAKGISHKSFIKQ